MPGRVAAAYVCGGDLFCFAVCDCGQEAAFDRREKMHNFLRIHRGHMGQHWKDLTPDCLNWSMHEDLSKARVRGPRQGSRCRSLEPCTSKQPFQDREVGATAVNRVPCAYEMLMRSTARQFASQGVRVQAWWQDTYIHLLCG